jgi:predicted MFS family arabinose efflux permease
LAIFNPSERASAASISNLTNTAGWTSASALSGYIIENIGTTISPLVSAIFVGFASQLYYFFFRDVKTPEEQESAKR